MSTKKTRKPNDKELREQLHGECRKRVDYRTAHRMAGIPVVRLVVAARVVDAEPRLAPVDETVTPAELAVQVLRIVAVVTSPVHGTGDRQAQTGRIVQDGARAVDAVAGRVPVRLGE